MIVQYVYWEITARGGLIGTESRLENEEFELAPLGALIKERWFETFDNENIIFVTADGPYYLSSGRAVFAG